MGSLRKFAAAVAFGLVASGAAAGAAQAADGDRQGRYDDRGGRPDRCDDDHDHRAHDARYYDFYQHDRYYRAGPYRGSGVSVSIGLGGGYSERYDRYDRYDGPRGGSRVVRRETFRTSYRATIQLVEEVVTRRGDRDLVCTVSVRGPDARYVRDRDVRRIAQRNCSPRSQIRIYA